eukprot:1188615-Prorocentrum_minimum.AAC.1
MFLMWEPITGQNEHILDVGANRAELREPGEESIFLMWEPITGRREHILDVGANRAELREPITGG